MKKKGAYMIEIMRKIICGLCIWNLILTAGLIVSFAPKQPDINQQICNVEMIPLEPLEGDL